MSQQKSGLPSKTRPAQCPPHLRKKKSSSHTTQVSNFAVTLHSLCLAPTTSSPAGSLVHSDADHLFPPPLQPS